MRILKSPKPVYKSTGDARCDACVSHDLFRNHSIVAQSPETAQIGWLIKFIGQHGGMQSGFSIPVGESVHFSSQRLDLPRFCPSVQLSSYL